MLRFYILSLSLIISASSLAETRYISDVLYVVIRSGQSVEHGILHKGLMSGTSVEFIEENPETKYSKIRLLDGSEMEGWILSRFLSDKPIARQRLKKIEQKYNQLSESVPVLQQQNEQLMKDNTDLKQQNDFMLTQSQQLKTELDQIKTLSGDVVNIYNTNQQLHNRNKELELLMLHKENENQQLKADNELDLLLKALGLIGISFCIGYIIASTTRNRKRSEWT